MAGLLEGLTPDLSAALFQAALETVPDATARAVVQGLAATATRDRACQLCQKFEPGQPHPLDTHEHACSACSVASLSATLSDHHTKHLTRFYRDYFGEFYATLLRKVAQQVTSRQLQEWMVQPTYEGEGSDTTKVGSG